MFLVCEGFICAVHFHNWVLPNTGGFVGDTAPAFSVR